MNALASLLPHLTSARMVGALTQPVLRVHTDTRSLQPGDLFVALRGERFDAHAFLPQAKSAGAVAAVAEHGLVDAGLSGVEVPDARRALGELARLWRSQFEPMLVAVTGSNGKTTVTQMIAAILQAAAGPASLATQGNLNNDIGVPLTLLRLRAEHRLAVIELGMNHPGEIAYLSALTQASVALVNNAQREHQEFMGTVEAVARENGAVISSLGADGVAVFPSDDAYTAIWRELAGHRKVLTFSDSDTHAEVHCLRADWQGDAWALDFVTPAGKGQSRIHIAGRHNVRNALAAVACAQAAGVPLPMIEQGLAAFVPVGGRSRALAVSLSGRQLTVVDDTYNANPDSVMAAIRVLAELPGPRMLVLGDMGEVGEQGLAFHLEVLREAMRSDIDAVHCTGEWMRQAVTAMVDAAEPAPRHWHDVPTLLTHVCEAVSGGETRSVLVKGSRFMRMERVVQGLLALHPAHGQSISKDAHAA